MWQKCPKVQKTFLKCGKKCLKWHWYFIKIIYLTKWGDATIITKILCTVHISTIFHLREGALVYLGGDGRPKNGRV